MRIENKSCTNIVAMIPVRMGSMRLKMKNLALLNGKPLFYYAINAAKDSKVFSRIVVNSEEMCLKRLADKYKVDFYNRPEKLSGSSAKSDCVVYDFVKNNACDIIVWVNTISPLQTGEEIKGAVTYFIRNNLDSLITVKDEHVHALYKNQPINFKIDEIFAQTQDLFPVQTFVYSLMMWKSKIFVSNFEKNGHAFFSGKIGFYPVNKLTGIIIKNNEDMMIADAIMKMKAKNANYRVSYDKMISEIKKS